MTDLQAIVLRTLAECEKDKGMDTFHFSRGARNAIGKLCNMGLVWTLGVPGLTVAIITKDGRKALKLHGKGK